MPRCCAAATSGDWLHHLHANNTSYRVVSTTQPELLVLRLTSPVVSDQPLSRDFLESTQRGGGAYGTTTVRTETTTTGLFDAPLCVDRTRQMLDASRRRVMAALRKLR